MSSLIHKPGYVIATVFIFLKLSNYVPKPNVELTLGLGSIKGRDMFRRTEILYQIFLVFIFGLVTTGCLLEPEVQPLPAGFIDEDNRLVEEVWLLTEARQQGKTIDFDAISPVTFLIGREGGLAVLTTECNSFSRKIMVDPNNQQYRLFTNTSTAIDCGELKNAQIKHLSDALNLTAHYEINDSQLVLFGEGVQFVLKPDPTNVFRGDYANLTRHSWYLVEITHQEMRIPFERVAPIIVNFERVSNWLRVQTTNCASFAYQFAPNVEGAYNLIELGISILPGCSEAKRGQVATVKQAIENTTRFKFENDQLHLFGDGVEVILAPEPISSNTSTSTSPMATPATP